MLYSSESISIRKDAVIKKLQNVEIQTEEIAVHLVDSEKLLKNASDYLTASRKALNSITDEPKTLQTTNSRLNTTLEEHYNGITAIEEILPEVQEHASNLSSHAQELDNLLSETRNISNNAIRAATAYKNIVEAVDDAQHAANTGKSAANNATSVLSEVSDDTITSSSLSADLLLSAHAANEESVTNLRPRLLEAEAKSRPVRSVHNANEDKLSEIERYLKAPHAKTYSSDLVNATNLATDSDTLAQNTLNNVETSFKEVSEEKKASQYLPNKIQDVRKNIQQTEKHLLAINEKFPEIERIIATLPEQQERVRLAAENINEKIKMLNQQIALARDVANRIKVGLKFYPNTTLELRNPPNVQDLSTSTYISGYFRTKDLNGLLLYLGNGHGTNLRRTTSDDYMALEVENGYLVLTADVGNGPQRVLNPKRVSDNNWYQFIIDRTAHNAKLTVREQIEDGQEQLHTASEDLQGHYTIFNLDKNKSKLFVGGYPSQFPVQEQVRQHSFNGEIEDLVIGEIPISLWNFNEGKENNHGAVRRDKLVNLQPSTGYRFNGNGYAIIDARSFLLRSRSDIKLSFKTFAPNGLLFLVHGSSNKTFISLEVRDGHVIYQYNLGYETKLYYTPKLYNDGNWHTIEASRAGSKGRLMVDGAEIADNGVAITGNVLETFETFIFGGYPKFHGLTEVSNVDFDGCIDNVTIGSPIDLSQNIKAYGVIPACPEKFARLVSFSEEKAGYIRNGDFSSNDLFQMNLKFKTKSKDGLIMFATDNFKTEGVSLGIVGGRLVLIAQKIKLETDDNNYNDNEWHVVTITHNITTLRLDIDDYATKVTDSPPPPIRVMYGEIFFGGLPANYDISKGMIPTRKSFSGCVIDASKNGAIINFASYKDKDGDILGRCVLDEEIGSDYHEVPTLPTIPEIAFITTKAPVFVTEDPVLANVPKRGDGAWQNSAGKRVTTYGPPETTEEVTEYVPHIFTSKPVEEIAPSPFPLPVTTPPEKMPQATRGPTVGPSCVLPMVPELDVTAPTTSYKYGGEPYSRSEYSVARGKFRSQFYFNLEFKTSATEGIIFYIESPPESQYVAVFLQNGHVIYTFSDGYGSAIMRSDQPYSDGAWHSVNASRNGASGKLIIDDETVADISPSNEIITSPLDLPHYIGVGGVPPTKITEVFKYINTTATFDGCIKNFRMNDFVMEDPNNFGVTPCSENIEPGAFFGIREGYIKLKEKHRVGLEIDVKLEIKPRNISGVLIAVHGRRDYLVLEMINGVIKLTVDNGKGAISTLFKPDKVHYFCDGQWHNIQAVKSKNVVTLSVDSTFTDPGVGDYRSQSTDTGGALFLGGHRYLSSARGIITRTSFVGCIRNVQVNNVPIKLTQKMAAGHVAVGSCPTV